MSKLDLITVDALDLVRLPYLWGGNDPVEGGLDCSGFIGYLWRKHGLLPKTYDDTAHGYYRRWKSCTVNRASRGCVVFYGKRNPKIRITHVMLCLSPLHCIGAVRGNSHVTSVEIARRRGAMVDIRKIDYRRDRIAIVNPFA